MIGIAETLRAEAALTTSYVVSSSMNVAELDNATLLLKYTNNGAANSVQLVIEESADNVTFYERVVKTLDASSGVGAIITEVLSFVAVAAPAAVDRVRLALKVPNNFFRVKVKETVAAGTAGLLEIKAVANRKSAENVQEFLVA